MTTLSPRLAAMVDALPLRAGIRVLEIGGAPGAAAKAVCERIAPGGHILVIDRSATGIARTERNASAEIAGGLLSVRQVAVEDFTLLPGEAPFDLAFAIRVGAFDGRHPRAGIRARERLRQALAPDGLFVIDGGTPLRGIDLASG
ncbi:SAM-dependent methyltransferase [Actinophytocola sediminis]